MIETGKMRIPKNTVQNFGNHVIKQVREIQEGIGKVKRASIFEMSSWIC